MINLISQFKIYIVVGVLALAAGFGFGYKTSQTIVKANTADAVAKVEKQSVQSIGKSNQIELNTAEDKTNIEVRYKTITKEIIKYVPETNEKECVGDSGARIATVLNANAVRMLNATDETADIQPADISEGETLTEVGLRELSEYIAEIKKQYEELAVEHDGMIEYNQYYQGLIHP